MKLLIQLAAILFGGSIVGLAANAMSARPANLLRAVYPASDSGTAVCGASPEAKHEVHGHRFMAQKDAVAACSDCTVAFVDARGAADFAGGHIPQAVHLPPSGHPGEADALQRLRGYKTVVIYDSGGGCGLKEGVADRLTTAGFADVRLLDGSWTDWMAAGGPAQSGACGACPLDGHAHGERAAQEKAMSGGTP
jgi:3-mercaptopyruvate sulfurtransferase SseA